MYKFVNTFVMKKIVNITEVKQYVNSLLGQKVSVKLNRGRNRIKHYQGEVSQAYPNVFVIKLYNDTLESISCNYCDIICGEIVLIKQSK